MSTAHDNWIEKARAVHIEDEITRRGIKLRRAGAELIGPCPRCGGDDRFAINTKKQVWNCRGCGSKGSVIDLVMSLDGVDFKAACTTLAGEPPPKPNGKANGKYHDNYGAIPKTVAAFEYCDENGAVLSVVKRLEFEKPDGTFVLEPDGKRKKIFPQYRPDPNKPGRLLKGVEGVRCVPYRLPELIEAIASGHTIYIVEGEAKADLLWSWNLPATCCAGGAKKWKAEHAAFLKDADVILVPDHDDAGWQHISIVGASLVGIAKRIRVLILPDLRPKGDVIDWARSGGTREQLDELVAKAPDWQAAEKLDGAAKEEKTAAKRSEDELLAAIAKMPKGVEFGRERKRLAKEFGVSRSDIDAEVEARRAGAEDTAPLHGHWFVEPWPEPADGDALIRDIIRKLQKHVVISYEGALAIAVWIMLAWIHDEVATHSPILNITSAEPDSGKTTTLGVISFLVPRAISSVDISRGALYRSIQRWQPSFVIDEFDDVLKAKADSDKSELRAVINSGHTRGQGVLRCITDEHRPEMFSTFSPKAIGMIGKKMPPATLSRCITIELRRRKKSERIVKFKHEDDSELAGLRSRLRRWSLDNAEALRGGAPEMPEVFENRRGDNWRVQFAIADLAGADWGEQARAAAVKIESGADSRSQTALLLEAIHIIFESIKDEAIGSQELCDKLAADPGSDWAEWGRSRKPISQNQLARMLKPHGVHPDQVRPKALQGKQIRGYHRSWFEDAWARYL
jgi:Protein of unknown function (DUF3631)/CHC2 zinc finger